MAAQPPVDPENRPVDESKIAIPDHFATPAKKALIVGLLEKYPVKKMAAAKAGVAETSLYRWLREDADFAELCDMAIERGKIAMLEAVMEAGSKPATWQAAAWVLERLDPATFGRIDRSKVEITTPGAGQIEGTGIDINSPSLDTRVKGVLKVLADAGRLPADIAGLVDAGTDLDDDAAVSARVVAKDDQVPDPRPD